MSSPCQPRLTARWAGVTSPDAMPSPTTCTAGSAHSNATRPTEPRSWTPWSGPRCEGTGFDVDWYASTGWETLSTTNQLRFNRGWAEQEVSAFGNSDLSDDHKNLLYEQPNHSVVHSLDGQSVRCGSRQLSCLVGGLKVSDPRHLYLIWSLTG